MQHSNLPLDCPTETPCPFGRQMFQITTWRTEAFVSGLHDSTARTDFGRMRHSKKSKGWPALQAPRSNPSTSRVTLSERELTANYIWIDMTTLRNSAWMRHSPWWTRSLSCGESNCRADLAATDYYATGVE